MLTDVLCGFLQFLRVMSGTYLNLRYDRFLAHSSAIPATERSQTHALNSTATGIDPFKLLAFHYSHSHYQWTLPELGGC